MESDIVHSVPIGQARFVSTGLGLLHATHLSVTYGPKDIGNAARRARERLGLSRDEAALKLGVDYETIKKIESGERVQKWLRVGQVAEVLKTSPNELLGFPVASPETLGMALEPILAAYGANPEDAESIARILLEAVAVAQSSQDDGPVELRYKMAGQLVAAQSRDRKHLKSVK